MCTYSLFEMNAGNSCLKLVGGPYGDLDKCFFSIRADLDLQSPNSVESGIGRAASRFPQSVEYIPF